MDQETEADVYGFNIILSLSKALTRAYTIWVD